MFDIIWGRRVNRVYCKLGVVEGVNNMTMAQTGVSPLPQFFVGDRVKLISRRFGPAASNPWWDETPVAGTVINVNLTLDATSTNHLYISVTWDNGRSNTYHHSDLAHLKEPHPKKHVLRVMPTFREFLKNIT